jgi:ferritin-like metal-binding protein YciE
MATQTLEDLFVIGLQYAYDAEKQLVEALPKMAQAASTPQLRQAFEQHLKETEEHAKRAEQLFRTIGKQAERKPNTVVKAMTQEADKMIQSTDQSPVRDAALIVAGNQVEHYEMAAYGSLANFAKLLGKQECVQSLQQTLEEEKKADAKLTEVGESQVNKQAANRGAASAGSR